MANGEEKIRRILHFRFTLPGAPAQMLPMIKSAASFYQLFGDAKVRLLQNVDDPDALHPGGRLRGAGGDGDEPPGDRQRSEFQAMLQAWRALFPGGVEIDVFQEA